MKPIQIFFRFELLPNASGVNTQYTGISFEIDKKIVRGFPKISEWIKDASFLHYKPCKNFFGCIEVSQEREIL